MLKGRRCAAFWAVLARSDAQRHRRRYDAAEPACLCHRHCRDDATACLPATSSKLSSDAACRICNDEAARRGGILEDAKPEPTADRLGQRRLHLRLPVSSAYSARESGRDAEGKVIYEDVECVDDSTDPWAASKALNTVRLPQLPVRRHSEDVEMVSSMRTPWHHIQNFCNHTHNTCPGNFFNPISKSSPVIPPPRHQFSRHIFSCSLPPFLPNPLTPSATPSNWASCVDTSSVPRRGQL